MCYFLSRITLRISFSQDHRMTEITHFSYYSERILLLCDVNHKLRYD